MKKISLMIAAFVFVHLVGAYLAWMGGFDFDKRGAELGKLAYFGVAFGGLASFIVFLFYEEKK